MVFLGIELDTVSTMLYLPQGKLERLRKEIQRWRDRAPRGSSIISLLGQLQHVCCVVKPGRSFLRRMIELAKVPKELHHRVRLNKGFWFDLCWWDRFLPWWNGTSMMSGVTRGIPQVVLHSDARLIGLWHFCFCKGMVSAQAS